MNRKGQVTIFIILGILILFSSALVIYIKKNVEDRMPEQEVVMDVPADFQKVIVFVEECLHTVAEEGLVIMGENAGFLEIDNLGLSLSNVPTESEGVRFFEDDDYVIPYWSYMDGGNKCTSNCRLEQRPAVLKSKTPYIDVIKKGETRDLNDDSMEAQLDRYIEDRFLECVADFKPLDAQGYTVTEAGDMTAITSFTRKDVYVRLVYPLVISKGSAKIDIPEFDARLEVPIEEIYRLVENITNAELSYKFLEVHVMNLISGFSRLEADALPPISEVSWDATEVIEWNMNDVKAKLENILAGYVGQLRVKDTLNYIPYYYSTPIEQALSDKMVIDTHFDEPKQIDVKFHYLGWWPIYLDVTPNRGSKITPEQIDVPFMQLMGGFGINKYNFDYDVSYPVIVELFDPNALGGRGYKFVFALEGNVRNNLPVEGGYTVLKVRDSQRSYLFDENQRTSANLTFNVTDIHTRELLDNVKISFGIGDEAGVIGVTEANESFVTKGPIGIGYMNFKKPGYRTENVLTAVGRENPLNYAIELLRYHDKEIELKKVLYSKMSGKWKFVGDELPLDDKEHAIVTLTPTGELEGESAVLLEVGAESDFKGIAKLLPGKYYLDVTVMYNGTIRIPKDKRCEGNWIHEECFKIDAMNLTPQTGGANINDPYFLEIEPDDLYEDGRIILYTIGTDYMHSPVDSRRIEDQKKLSKWDKLSITYNNFLQPVFVRN